MHDHQANAWKGLAAGLVAGLAATYVMTRFQELSAKLEEKLKEENGDSQGKKAKKGDDATVKTASRISRALFDHELTAKEKKTAGPAVHYGFGILNGAAYGTAAELAPAVTRGMGAPFGTAFGLSGPPWESPPAVHAKALAAHLVYGLTTEAVRRLVRRAL
jgi:hypothetical protein